MKNHRQAAFKDLEAIPAVTRAEQLVFEGLEKVELKETRSEQMAFHLTLQKSGSDAGEGPTVKATAEGQNEGDAGNRLITQAVIESVDREGGGAFSYKATKWNTSTAITCKTHAENPGTITQNVRELGMGEKAFNRQQRLMRTPAFDLEKAGEGWRLTVGRKFPVMKMDTRMGPMILMPADGTTDHSESTKGPYVERVRQSSGDSTKRERLAGVKYNGVGVACKAGEHEHTVLLSLERVSSSGATDALLGVAHESEYARLQRQIQRDAGSLHRAGVAQVMEGNHLNIIDPQDAGSYKEEVFRTGDSLAEAGVKTAYNLVKAHSNGKAYEKPPENKGGRGRPRKKGDKVKLRGVFDDPRYVEDFRKVKVEKPDGTCGNYEVMAKELLWGEGYYKNLLFVFSRDLDAGTQSVFMTDALFLTPEQVVYAYLRRFSQEHCFKDVKQVIHGLDYTPWTESCPELKIRFKNEKREELLSALDGEDREKALACLEALDRNALLACVSQGTLALLSLESGGRFGRNADGYHRPRADGRDWFLTVEQVHRLLSACLDAQLERAAGSEVADLIVRLRKEDDAGKETDRMLELVEEVTERFKI